MHNERRGKVGLQHSVWLLVELKPNKLAHLSKHQFLKVEFDFFINISERPVK